MCVCVGVCVWRLVLPTNLLDVCALKKNPSRKMKVVAAPPPPPAVFLRSYLLARLLLVNNVQTQPRLTREVLQLFCQSDKERKTTMQLVDATLSTPGEPYIMHEGRVFQKRLRDALLSALHCRETQIPSSRNIFFLFRGRTGNVRTRPLNSRPNYFLLV